MYLETHRAKALKFTDLDKRNKIGIIEYCKYKKIIKNRNSEDNKIFYITNINKNRIYNSNNEKYYKNI